MRPDTLNSYRGRVVSKVVNKMGKMPFMRGAA